MNEKRFELILRDLQDKFPGRNYRAEYKNGNYVQLMRNDIILGIYKLDRDKK